MKNTRGIRGPAGVPVGQISNTGGAASASALAAAEGARPSLRDTLTQSYDNVMAQKDGQTMGGSPEAAMLAQGQAPQQQPATPPMPGQMPQPMPGDAPMQAGMQQGAAPAYGAGGPAGPELMGLAQMAGIDPSQPFTQQGRQALAQLLMRGPS